MELVITAEINIPDDMVYDENTALQDILNEVVFIKSGLYENIATGNVVSIQKIPRKDS
jgi:hypothetical protein